MHRPRRRLRQRAGRSGSFHEARRVRTCTGGSRLCMLARRVRLVGAGGFARAAGRIRRFDPAPQRRLGSSCSAQPWVCACANGLLWGMRAVRVRVGEAARVRTCGHPNSCVHTSGDGPLGFISQRSGLGFACARVAFARACIARSRGSDSLGTKALRYSFVAQLSVDGVDHGSLLSRSRQRSTHDRNERLGTEVARRWP